MIEKTMNIFETDNLNGNITRMSGKSVSTFDEIRKGQRTPDRNVSLSNRGLLKLSPRKKDQTSNLPPIVSKALNSHSHPLDPHSSAFMESYYGYDFSHVRIHSDAKAAASAKWFGSKAYTVGNNIVFGTGYYTPNTYGGCGLIAHELAHVIQQCGCKGRKDSSRLFGRSGDKYEREADRAADLAQHVFRCENKGDVVNSGDVQSIGKMWYIPYSTVLLRMKAQQDMRAPLIQMSDGVCDTCAYPLEVPYNQLPYFPSAYTAQDYIWADYGAFPGNIYRDIPPLQGGEQSFLNWLGVDEAFERRWREDACDPYAASRIREVRQTYTGRMKPDIVDVRTKEYYEIKPDTDGSVGNGINDLTRYDRAFNRLNNLWNFLRRRAGPAIRGWQRGWGGEFVRYHRGTSFLPTSCIEILPCDIPSEYRWMLYVDIENHPRATTHPPTPGLITYCYAMCAEREEDEPPEPEDEEQPTVQPGMHPTTQPEVQPTIQPEDLAPRIIIVPDLLLPEFQPMQNVINRDLPWAVGPSPPGTRHLVIVDPQFLRLIQAPETVQRNIELYRLPIADPRVNPLIFLHTFNCVALAITGGIYNLLLMAHAIGMVGAGAAALTPAAVQVGARSVGAGVSIGEVTAPAAEATATVGQTLGPAASGVRDGISREIIDQIASSGVRTGITIGAGSGLLVVSTEVRGQAPQYSFSAIQPVMRAIPWDSVPSVERRLNATINYDGRQYIICGIAVTTQ
jgi:hypothetical protein